MDNKKQLIINADDFGYSDAVNNAVFRAYKQGILTSASLMANAPAFDGAVAMLKDLSGLSVGIHLNVIEFSTLQKNLAEKSLLFDRNGRYNNSVVMHLIKSFNNDYLKMLEYDFRLQIEKILEKTEISHIDSHVHIHAIPNIFKLVCKLAKEYKIPNIRTQFEIPYFVPDFKKYLSIKYPINLLKLLILNTFSLINNKEVKKNALNSNKNFIGVSYTGFMDKNTLKYALKDVNELTEAIFHPSSEILKKNLYNEFSALLDSELPCEIERLGIKLTDWNQCY